MIEKNTPAYWRSLRIGSVVEVSDSQALDESMVRQEGVESRSYTIEAIRTIQEQNALATWLMFKLVGNDEELWLTVKIVDKALSLFIYWAPGNFEPASKAEVIHRGDRWLFTKPKGKKSAVRIADVEYAAQTDEQEIDAFGVPTMVSYALKDQGVLYGATEEIPQPEGMPDRVFTVIVEWKTGTKCENPHLMALEFGGEESEDDGYLELYLGAEVNAADLEILEV